MSYFETKFASSNLWNVKVDPTDVDLNMLQIMSSSTPSLLNALMVDGADQWNVAIKGNFDLSNNPKTAYELTKGTVTNLDVRINGVLWESVSDNTGFDLIKWLTNLGYRYSLLSGDDRFTGSTANPLWGDEIRGGNGNDDFTGYKDGIDANGKLYYDSFFGEAGRDTAHYQGKIADYRIDTHANIWDGRFEVSTIGVSVTDTSANRDGTDHLKEVERLEFTDMVVGLDVGPGQNTGQVYRLYLTVLGRNPQADAVGCGFWIDKLDEGVLTATKMVGNFLNSTEFTARFGSITNSNESFVNLMYTNLLGRDGHPDSGFSFWLNVLDNKLATREEVVVGFMESPENVANAASLIGDTPTFKQWVG